MKLRTLALTVPLALGLQATANAAGKIEIDEDKWISVGAGARSSFSAVEDSAPSGDDFSKDFAVNNARVYINGAVNERIGFELNTECLGCDSSDGELVLLDAVGKFSWSPQVNIWAGRLLVPSDRAEMSGPFYASVFEGFKTPFFSSDQGSGFGNGAAGRFGRDHGINLWGSAGPEGAIQYVVGAFDGLNSSAGQGPNQDDSLLYAGRFSYNFWNVEQNPGYYTSSTYYGGAGDVLTLAYAFQYQEDGAGSFNNPEDFLGMSVDLLMEKVLDNQGVATVEAEYKYFDSGVKAAAFADPDCFCLFDGDAWSVTALYLLPQKTGMGRLQPYARFSAINPDNSSDRDETEAGLNYIIDGHNARVSLFYQYGDLATKGIANFAPGVDGDEIHAIKLGFQLQI